MNSPFLDDDGIVRIEVAEDILVYQCNFDLSGYYPELFQELNVNFPLSLSKAVKKRQSEYLAGRFIAHYALSKLGLDVTDIPSGKDRSPIWPDGICGSITHTNKKAICAVAHSSQCELLGLDLELWIKTTTANEIKQLIINENEQSILSILGWTGEKSLTLAFSAKESLFKALYPKVQKYFNFDAARLTSLSLEDNSFTLQLVKDLSRDFPHSSLFKGHFIVSKDEILTIIFKTS